jgi:GNAT superfamily N-acetyltransferase
MTEVPPARIRHRLKPGDTGRIVYLHGLLYAREYGFDHTFEAYVAEPLARFVRAPRAMERIWLVDREGLLQGSLAVVEHDKSSAQLRWFLLHPLLRGRGLGRQLAAGAVEYSRQAGYRTVFLWTVRGLEAAARIYRSLGFALTDVKPGKLWGCSLTEERYELVLAAGKEKPEKHRDLAGGRG